MEIEIFEIDGGFGFKVGNVYQEFDPELEWLVPMSRARAEALASEVQSRLDEG